MTRAESLAALRASGEASEETAARHQPGQGPESRPMRRWRVLVWIPRRRWWIHYFTADGRDRREALRCVAAQGFHFTRGRGRRWVLARFYRDEGAA